MDTDPNTDGDQIGYDSLGNVEVTTIEQAAATTASTAARRTTPCAVSPAPTSSSAAAATTPCGPIRLRPPPRPWSMP
jgi:hypothetical protein